MLRFVSFVLAVVLLLLPDAGRAHDLPGEILVSGFFDAREDRPELVLRVPLVLLTNVNLAKRGPGYLDLAKLDDGMARAERAVTSAFGIASAGRTLTPVEVQSRISQPSERTFGTFESAAEAIMGPPLAAESNVFWNQGFFDIRLQYPADGVAARYALRMDLPQGLKDRILISISIVGEDGALNVLDIDGSVEEIALDPAWYQSGFLFLTKGVEHILIGTDHLLFLLCLILPLYRDLRRLLVVVTAFTLGHSATLVPAALGFVPSASWFLPLVETLIAVSILYMAIENAMGLHSRFRWRLAFGFGLVHGFGFASTLTDVVQFAGSHLVISLMFFNVGIEIGQVLLLAVAVPLIASIFRTPGMEKAGILVISILAGHQALHWATERAAMIQLSAGFGPDLFVVLTWIGLATAAALVIWWLGGQARNRRGATLR